MTFLPFCFPAALFCTCILPLRYLVLSLSFFLPQAITKQIIFPTAKSKAKRKKTKLIFVSRTSCLEKKPTEKTSKWTQLLMRNMWHCCQLPEKKRRKMKLEKRVWWIILRLCHEAGMEKSNARKFSISTLLFGAVYSKLCPQSRRLKCKFPSLCHRVYRQTKSRMIHRRHLMCLMNERVWATLVHLGKQETSLCSLPSQQERRSQWVIEWEKQKSRFQVFWRVC